MDSELKKKLKEIFTPRQIVKIGASIVVSYGVGKIMDAGIAKLGVDTSKPLTKIAVTFASGLIGDAISTAAVNEFMDQVDTAVDVYSAFNIDTADVRRAYYAIHCNDEESGVE